MIIKDYVSPVGSSWVIQIEMWSIRTHFKTILGFELNKNYMLELRPICENCGKDLPNDSTDAMICTFECTFCAQCVTKVLENVCPNCGGGFERRPTRPSQCITENCIDKFPAGTGKKFRPVDFVKFKPLKEHFAKVNPRMR